MVVVFLYLMKRLHMKKKIHAMYYSSPLLKDLSHQMLDFRYNYIVKYYYTNPLKVVTSLIKPKGVAS